MKIRTGFVSNSSSCSFCIYGAAVDTDEFIKKLTEKAESIGLYVSHVPEYSDVVYIGKFWREEGDSKPIECKTYQESWFDG